MISIVVTGSNPLVVTKDAKARLKGKNVLWSHGPDEVDFHEFRKADIAVQPTSVHSFAAFAPNQKLYVYVALYDPT